MKTIELTQSDMAQRVARYRELKPLPTQSAAGVPLEAKDVIYARKLLSVIGLESGSTPVSSNAPIRGAAGMTMTLAVCPPGQGPELHAHVKTYETFTVLRAAASRCAGTTTGRSGSCWRSSTPSRCRRASAARSATSATARACCRC